VDMPAGRNGAVFCTNCGQKLTPEDRFCPECGTPRPKPPMAAASPPEFTSSLTTASTLGSFTGAPPLMSMIMAPAVANPSQPLLQYDVDYPERQSRLLIFAKYWLGSLLVLPHAIVLFFLFVAVLVIWPISWFAILFTGHYPRGMWSFVLSVLRWTANVTAYGLGQRDEYPPFSGTGPYPVQFELAYPERLSRLLIFVKWLFVIPSVFVLMLLGIIANFAILFGWIALLFTGHFPRSLFDFVTGTTRWSHRIATYSLLLTDAYPPFRMGP
jgi:hypothetical protein